MALLVEVLSVLKIYYMKETIETIKRLWFVILMGVLLVALFVILKTS
jgi:hypothetical protein